MENKLPAWEQNKTHIQDYLFLLRKRWWLIIACFLVTFSLAVLYNSIQIPIYQASTTVEINEKKNQIVLPNQRNYSYQDYTERQRAFETHFKILKSYPIISQIVDRLQLREVYARQKKKMGGKRRGIKKMLMDFQRIFQSLLNRVMVKQPLAKIADTSKTIPTYDPVVGAVQNSLTVTPVVDTNLVNLICRHPDPVMSVHIPNALAEIYRENIDRKQRNMNRENFQWISDELERLKKTLDRSEEELHKYKEKSKILSMEVNKNIESQELAQLRSDYNATLARRTELQAQVKELEYVTQKKRLHVPGFVSSDILKNIGNKLVKAQLELNRLFKTYKSKHPLIIKANAHIASIKEQFSQELIKVANGTKSQIKVLTSKEKTLLATLNRYRERAISSTPTNIQFARLDKETQTNTELYNYLMKQLKSLDIREKAKEREITIVERAKLPTTPISPRKRMNLILGALTGLILGVSLASFIEYLDRSIKNIGDVENFLDLPVLGIIPRFNKEQV